MTVLDGLFWSQPPEDEGGRPTDPLGLDGMREELSDRLVPCLTGRTWSHEEFFWSLVFVRWVEEENDTDEARIARFLHWERCLKLHWARAGRAGFTGVNRAREQASAAHAPSTVFRPLLVNQRAQGMLGTHLGPLRRLGLISENAITLTDDGRSLIAGAGSIPNLVNGQWSTWTRVFNRAAKAFDGGFRNRLRARLAVKMPDLYAALAAVGWRRRTSWRQAAQHIGPAQRPFALLAGEFCPWADNLRGLFHKLIQSPPKDPAPMLPPRLSRPIPPQLERWNPLRTALRGWRRREGDRVLAGLHRRVFAERGYEHDLWVRWEDGRRHPYPARANSGVSSEGSDCRWANAVRLMKPGT